MNSTSANALITGDVADLHVIRPEFCKMLWGERKRAGDLHPGRQVWQNMPLHEIPHNPLVTGTVHEVDIFEGV